MSDKPSILEGGSSRNFNPVDVLGINKQSNGRSTWVLADSVEVGSLDASQNGLYLAIEDDYFAYDQIVVNVSDDLADADDATKATGKIVGKDPDLDPNNDYAVGLDEEGNLTKEMIPAAIHIVVPPRKLKYKDGETLDFTGIHVYLMDGNNQRYTDEDYPTGEIPFDELLFPVTEATAVSYGDVIDVSEDFLANKNQVLPFSLSVPSGRFHFDKDPKHPEYDWADSLEWISDADCSAVFFSDDTNDITILCASKAPISFKWRWNMDDMDYSYTESESTNPYVYNSKPAYFINLLSFSHRPPDETPVGTNAYIKAPEVEIDGVSNSGFNKYAWAMLYGTLSIGSNEIPVQWMRSDGEILEDTFKIYVVEEEEPVPEPEPDPWGGYADVSWNRHHYNLNRRIVPEVHYANGYLWQEGISTEYSVEQAASMGWLILIR